MADISKIKLPDGNTYDIKTKKTICPIYTVENYSSPTATCNYTFTELKDAYNNGYNIAPLLKVNSEDIMHSCDCKIEYSNNAITINIFIIDYSSADSTEYISQYAIGHTNIAIAFARTRMDNLQQLLSTTTVTTSSGYTHSSGWGMYNSQSAISTTTYPTIKRYGNVIYFNGIFSNNSQVAAGTNPTIGTIASAYRPSEEFRIVIHGSLQNIAIAKFATDGKVGIERYGTTASTAAIAAKSWIPIQATWII